MKNDQLVLFVEKSLIFVFLFQEICHALKWTRPGNIAATHSTATLLWKAKAAWSMHTTLHIEMSGSIT